MMKRFLSLLTALLILSACTQNDTYVKPEVNSVYYEIFVGSFYDSDEDGMGDLEGVRQKLDYIQYDLGATGIIGIVGAGDKSKAFDVARTMIAQIAANNSYRDVKLAFAFFLKLKYVFNLLKKNSLNFQDLQD